MLRLTNRSLRTGTAAGDEVEPAVERVPSSAGDLVGIVLAVGVHQHDVLAVDVVEPDAERRGLARVAAQADVADRSGCAARPSRSRVPSVLPSSTTRISHG